MKVTREKIIELLTEEMKILKSKITYSTNYAHYCFYNTDLKNINDYNTWKKKAEDSERYQRRYIATKYARAIFTMQFSNIQIFLALTTDIKKLVARIVNYYGLEASKKANVTWDMTRLEIETVY